MDRCALFVDAGYVLADGAMAVHGTRNRESVSWDYPGVIQFLGNLARDRTGLSLLRCYWYEATVEGRRTPEHDALADLPGVKLRLGRMRPGRREGVESEIHRDLATLARNGAISDALVVSAEEDLAQVITEVQDLGVRVTLVHITVDGNWTISRTLRQECDDIIEIGEAHLRPYVELVMGAEPVAGEEREAVGAYGRAPSNGYHSVGMLAQQQALPVGSHAAPPAIYTAPVIAEYQQQAAQPSANGQPAPMAAHGTPRSPGGPAPGVHGSAPAQQARPGQGEQSAVTSQPGMPAVEPPGPGQPAAHPSPGMQPAPGPAAQPAQSPQQPPAQQHGSHLPGPPPHASPQQEPHQHNPHQHGPPQPGPHQPGAPARQAPQHVPPDTAGSRGMPPAPLADPARPGGPGGPGGPGMPPPAPAAHGPGGGPAAPHRQQPGQQGPPGMTGQPGMPPPQPPGTQQPPGVPAGHQPYPSPPEGPGYRHPVQEGPGAPDPGRAAGARAGQGPAGPAGQEHPGPRPYPPGPPPGHDPRAGQPYHGSTPGRGDPRMPGPPYVPPQGPYGGPQPGAQHVPARQPTAMSLADAVQSAHGEGFNFGQSVAREAPALWLEAVLARKPRMPSDLEARLLQDSSLPIDSLLHDEVRHALRRGFWDALERSRH